ncbi:pentatricopeptide repeat-containing protein 2, mitochondrial [Dunckerocampus dactyliophorus]|uniref:pentatricopeptide repeat-containing protein 2, mitochondrial n=1 Tax=Dunckerocampus dactyliophorus TaxID=161453 RepID=UPI0024069F53|nr:pentatricopeptide repeat-containing protein 2, mitochondrial [Dunckerocampus dactyliophorus]
MALRRFSSCCRSLLRDSSCSGILSALSQPGWIGSRLGAKRHLLSEDAIRLQDFQRRKLAVAHLIAGSDGNFIELLAHKLQSNRLILQDELKLLLHLCQSVEDMMIARDAIYRYHAENSNRAHGEFRFGPLFMRLCYELGLEKMAADVLTDKEMRGFFSDTTSFNIAIDMLFMKGYHEDALEVLRSMRSQRVPFNKDTLMLVSGVCYKLNTAESHMICTSLIEEAQAKGQFILRHAYCFAVALALRRNDIEKAQLLFSQIMSTDGRLCQNLKVLLLAMSGATDDAIMLLSAATVSKTPSFVRKPEFSQEVLDLVHLQTEDGAQMAKAEQVASQLERAGQVTRHTLDDMLCHTPTNKAKPVQVMEQRRLSKRTLKPLQSTLLSE